MGCLHDPANVQQTSSKCIQYTRANAGRLLDRVNTLLQSAHRSICGIRGPAVSQCQGLRAGKRQPCQQLRIAHVVQHASP